MTPSTTTYNITPLGKPRMTQRDKWASRPAVLRYRVFCDECRLAEIMLGEFGASVTFVLPMPKSWSAKKRQAMDGKPHQQKPDIDNLLKALLDALFDDDSRIWNISATKIWGQAGHIIVTNPGGSNDD